MDGDPSAPAPAPEPEARPRKGLVRAFTCPVCGGTIQIRAAGYSLSAACGSCRSVVDVTNENYRVLSKFAAKKTKDPLIPFGQRGMFFGKIYEVIGFMERSDVTGKYIWQEYLLFNPYHGFRWLLHDHGHWNFVTMIKEKPRPGDPEHEGRSYRKYLQGKARVCYVLGEFYWRVKVGDEVGVQDFIHPPYLLSHEWDKSEETWSHTVYVEPSEVRKAFALEADLPPKQGVAPNQPYPHEAGYRGMMFFFVLALGALVAIEVMSYRNALNQVAWGGTLHYTVLEQNKTLITPEFELKKEIADIVIELNTPVDNNWLEADISLINKANEQTIQVAAGAESYSGVAEGVEDGERWTEHWREGDPNQRIHIPSVPGGTYYLAVTTAAGPGIATMDYTLRVVRDVLPFSNFMIAIAAVSVFPLIARWRRSAFEKERWSNSDFSPYSSGGSDDDESE